MASREEHLVPSWDGEVTGWPDYSRRVRLCYSQTQESKRYTLGPKLVLKLKGKAWEVAASLDHERLGRKTGTQYLMKFLKSKLGRLPIPDIGQHLDEVFVRLRRGHWTDMVTWCNQVRETYKKLQRSLARTMAEKRSHGVQTDPVPAHFSSDMPSSPTSSTRRRVSGEEPQQEPPEQDPQETSPTSPADCSPSHAAQPDGPRDDESEWHDEDWGSSSGWRWHRRDDWWWHRDWRHGDAWDDDDMDDDEWEDLETTLPQILPEEVLGWLLLRRSGLASSAKMSVLAASGNSLRFHDVEKALRQQEEEILAQERHKPSGFRAQRNYWVETDGAWGLLLNDTEDLDNVQEESIQWVDNEVMATLGVGTICEEPPLPVLEPETSWMTDGSHDWCWHDDEWYTPTSEGWIAYSEMKPWLDIEDVALADPVAGKELGELFSTFETKVRTFKEARDAMQFKGKSRGFYPYSPKGKSKGNKGFGKGKNGKKGSTQGTSFVATPNPPSSLNPKGKGAHQKPGYTGCFICGDLTHDFRSCPKRGHSANHGPSHTGKAKLVCMVEESDVGVSSSSQSQVPAQPVTLPSDVQRMILAAHSDPLRRLGYAVVDTGATETVGSLEAIEHIMLRRRERFGPEEIGIHPSKQKRFKFGNAQERTSESFLVLPQSINGIPTSLGIYTLDVPGVPILLGIKTMKKLGALINVVEPSLVFTKVFPGVRIPLIRGQNGHLLLDLCTDWTTSLVETDMDTNPVEKGEGRQESQVQHNVHVLEDEIRSDSSGACSERIPDLCYDDHVHGTMDAPPQPSPSTDSLSSAHLEPLSDPTHGAIRRDIESQHLPGELRNDRQDHGNGDPDAERKVQDRYQQVRLDQSAVLRSPRSPKHPRGLSWPPQSGDLRQGKLVGEQQTRTVAHMQSMQAASDVCADSRREGLLPLRRTLGQGCDREAGRPEESSTLRTKSQQSEDPNPCLGCSGELSHPPCGGGATAEGESQGKDEISTDPPEGGDRSRSCGIHRHQGLPQEESQKGESKDLRETRVRGRQDLGDCDPLDDRPRSLSNDRLGLKHHVYEEGVFSCTHSLTETEAERIAADLKHAHEDLVEILGTLKVDRCNLLEVCCAPDSRLTEKVRSKGGTAFRVGFENDMDLSTVRGFERAQQFAEQLQPEWMWLSLPCGPNSPIQNMNQKSPEQIRSLRKKKLNSKKIIRNGVKLAQDQLNRGGHVVWEWPRTNFGWGDPELKKLLHAMASEGLLHVAMLDGCQVGVVAADTGEAMLKPWKLVTSSSHMKHTLSLRCPGDHVHAECLGHGRAHASAFYPDKMCSIISQVILEHSRTSLHVLTNEAEPILAVQETAEGPVTEAELKHMKDTVRKLHVRCGHPTNRALVNMLRARGVDHRFLQLASEHKCDDCMEVKLPTPHMGVTLHQSETLWHTLQADIAQFIVKDVNIHILIMTDEASKFTVAKELFRHPREESRNPTTEEVIQALEEAWIQYHGLPNILRTDPEGCFRGSLLDDWGSSRGVEIQHCAGEDHASIGVVESAIGKIKSAARALLRSQDIDPYLGILQVVNAHNQLDRIGGYAPAQWAYGRLPSLDGRLFEGGNSVPVHASEGTLGTDLRSNLQIRVKAEEFYRKQQAAEKVSRAMNSQTRKHTVFLPGDLVYYRRYKTPRSQGPSHPEIDTGKVGLARWFGPARVLATETRVGTDPDTRKPGGIVWIVGAGRLKRCSPSQLRHCSEREKLLAERSEALTTPWSFNSLMHLVERGQFQRYDDLEEDENRPQFRERELRGQSVVRGRSRSRPPVHSPPVHSVHRSSSEPRPPEDGQRKQQEPESQQEAKPTKAGPTSEKSRRTRDHSYNEQNLENTNPPKIKKGNFGDKGLQAGHTAPTGAASSQKRHGTELEQHPPFQRAKKKAADWESIKDLSLSELLDDGALFSVESTNTEDRAQVMEVSIPLPQSRTDLKKFVKNSASWTAKQMKKGVEMKWRDIPADRIEDFQRAKAKEIDNWVKQAAMRLAPDDTSRKQLMKMRWIYTLKSDNSAKARIVIIGYMDPDLLSLEKSSPVMTRRTRGLFLTYCSLMQWTILKGDVRAAFLQGRESERERKVFAQPVEELAEALGGSKHSTVQILKACYGLANAPSQWHSSVSETMREGKWEVLRVDACAWRLVDRSDPDKPRTIGLACAHVDDFLFAGESEHPLFQQAVSHIHQAYQWTPWEVDSFQHCGVHLTQGTGGQTTLDHSDYCTTIDQIVFDHKRDDRDKISPDELQQLRAVLGGIQWRVYQSAPQHSARLSNLQSQLKGPTVATLKEANKLVREVYNGRHVGLRYECLEHMNPLDTTFVAWCDAAVGNRCNFASSGGYFIGACNPKILAGLPSKVCPISWKSGRLPRVARSSLSAEIQAFSIAEEELMLVRMEWLELCGLDIPTYRPTSILPKSQGVLVTDAKSLYDVILKGPRMAGSVGLKEKYSILDMLGVFERLEIGGTLTRWVHSDAQIGDSLTKPVANSSLIRVLTTGVWTLVDDPNFKSAKKLKALAKQESSSKILGACQFVQLLDVIDSASYFAYGPNPGNPFA